MLSSYFYLLSLFIIAVALAWLLVAWIRHLSKRRPSLLMLWGIMFLIWAIVLLNVQTTWLAWAFNAGMMGITVFITKRNNTSQESRTEKPLPPILGMPEPTSETPYYLEIEEIVPSLKREQKYEEAIVLLQEYVTGTENDARTTGVPVRSWPYQQLAIIYRKQKRNDEEIAILERFSQQLNSGSKQSRQLLKRLGNLYDVGHTQFTPHLVGRGLIIDCETTGLSGTDELIEIGLVSFEYSKATGEVMRTLEEYSSLREPNCPISSGATAQHGLTINDVRGKQLDITKCQTLIAESDILVAHNASFDRRFIEKIFPDTYNKRWLCSMNGVRWKQNGHTSKSLQSLLIDHSLVAGSAHRALDDARATLQLISQTNPTTGERYLAEILDSAN